MDDLLSEFLTESVESLDVVDVELVKFEQDPNNEEILANIFRLVHTIKGTCGFLGLPRLEALAHAAETLMGKFRDGAPVTKDAVSLILGSLDRIKEILSLLEENETEPEGSDDDLISKLDALSNASEESDEAESDNAAAADTDINAGTDADASDANAIEIVERELKPGEVSLEDLERAFQETEGPVSAEAAPEAKEPEEQKVEPAKIEPVEAQAKPEPAKSGEKKEKSVTKQSIRVSVETLETLMTMVSELVLTRNQLLEMVRRLDDSEFKNPLQRLSSVTAELQEGVMQTRMQPVGNAWQKLPRIIRDLGQDLDKKIDLVMNGAETELDRQVLDLIKDPLTHMVRNSADHGLEPTAKRLELGKPETGTVTLSAYHEGGHIIIEIADDGAGLNVERISKKVIENGLATEAELERMSDAQIHKFIFKAGFSTAENVTSVSGRGVGMDVVRTNIELISGSVDVKSTPGKGSTFFIKIPLTLAIVSALIVKAGEERFAVPQLNVIELVRVQSSTDHKIEMINDTPLLRLRDKLLPLVHLSDLLELEAPVSAQDSSNQPDVEVLLKIQPENKTIDADQAAITNSSETSPEDGNFIIVTQVGPQKFGIIVDNIYDTEEIVVKPMSGMFRSLTMFSGNTILGDGSVILIVDPNGVAQAVNTQSADAAANEDEDKTGVEISRAGDEITSLLLIRAGSQDVKAVPLSLVTRIEEINAVEITASNGRELVQYRGQLMPLIYVEDGQIRKTEGTQPVLVFTDGDRVMGLVVDDIVDIVEDRLKVEVTSPKPGMIGSAIIREEATDVIDVGHYLPLAFDDWFKGKSSNEKYHRQSLLLVDDSAFFRDMLSPVLTAHGYDVVAVSSSDDVFKLKDDGHQFDLIISDIEMPGMNGFEFAEAIAEDDKWGETPIIALFSQHLPKLAEDSEAFGIKTHVAKFDREGLIESVKNIFNDVGEAA